MLIKRYLKEIIKDKLLNSNKIIILYGPRQSGKTTLANEILSEINLKILKISADERKYIDILSSQDSRKIESLIYGYDILFIDEAQRIKDIGINLKIMHDQFTKLKILATGSSSFELANKTKEPLTGRTLTFILFPLAILELYYHYNKFDLNDLLEEIMIYGLYPEIFNQKNINDKYLYLKELSQSYLYKDVLEFSGIRHSDKIHDLLRLLAFQIGQEVSMNELANNLNLSKETIEKYILILEKAFVLFRLSGFSRNLRKEITKMDKIYFYDTGVRNIIIDNLKPLNLRDDAGRLWENFLVAERIKNINYKFVPASSYFWRTYTGAELDYIEESQGKFYGFEFKFNNKKGKIPKTWLEIYKGDYQTINKDNYLDFIL